MLPTEPQNKLDKIDLSTAEPSPKTAQRLPLVLLQTASRSLSTTGHFIAKNPFWVLLIGSLGIHAGLALFTPNPLKKAPPEEILVSTPVIQLPPKNRSITSKTLPQNNKSALDNLFVKPLDGQNNTFSDLPLQTLDPDDARAIRDDFPEDNANLPEETYEPKPTNTPKPKPESDRITADGKIDDTSPKATSDDNLKPELRNNAIKDDQPSPNPQNNPQNDSISKQPKVNSGNNSTSSSNGDGDKNEQEFAVDNVATIYTTNGRILELLAKKSLKTTQIAPQEANIPNPDQNREKEVAWIAPKTTDFAGKTGSVVFMWLVKPDGEVEAVFVKTSGHKELDDIVREAVKDYKFKPIAPEQKDMYRLVTAKYDFPPK